MANFHPGRARLGLRPMYRWLLAGALLFAPRRPVRARYANGFFLAPALLLLLAGSGSVAAPSELPMPTMDEASCERFAALPNSPMSVEGCRKMMQMGKVDPSAQRPGDDAMTCAQIHAEMVKLQPKGVSAAEAARHEKLVEDGRTLTTRRAAETAAVTAPIVAQQTAIAMLPLPNAVSTALLMPQQKALEQVTAAAGQRFVAETRQTTAGAADIIGSKLGSDPRLPRLAQLSASKHCTH